MSDTRTPTDTPVLLHTLALDAPTRASLAASPWGACQTQHCPTAQAALEWLAESPALAWLLGADASTEGADDVAQWVAAAYERCPVLLVTDRPDPERVTAWVEAGAQDVLSAADLSAPGLALRVSLAAQRWQRERAGRNAYATDLHTGLPHQQQLMEHMSQLMALREREPAPMALLVLRVEGMASTQARFGREAAQVLRRKVGVRLRAGVRASDVVAALGDDNFAILLGSLLAPADAERVGAKLARALLDPFKVAGHDVAVATAVGIAQYPADGPLPDSLLRRALGLAAAGAATGRAGFANFTEGGAVGTGAANDD